MHTVYRKGPARSQALHAFLGTVAALAAFLAAGNAAASAPACGAEPPRIAVAESMPPPTIDNSLSQPQLQRIAAHRHPGRSLGLYHATVNGHFDAQLEVRWDEGEACLRVASIALRVEAVDRRIWVIRERRPGTCEYEAVLTHERQHQKVDEAVVGSFVPMLREALARRAAALGVVRVQQSERDAAQKRLIAAIDETFQAEMRAMQEERERRQEAVDTPTEYRRVGAACDPLRDKK